jgi:HTH-type transcriptional regulator / antitoxin HipB
MKRPGQTGTASPSMRTAPSPSMTGTHPPLHRRGDRAGRFPRRAEAPLDTRRKRGRRVRHRRPCRTGLLPGAGLEPTRVAHSLSDALRSTGPASGDVRSCIWGLEEEQAPLNTYDRAYSTCGERESPLICTIMQMKSRLSPLIAAEVRRTRSDQELLQSELAFAAGVSVRTVHEIEAGKPTIRLDVLERVLTALGLTIEVTPRHRRSTPLGER